MSPAALVGVLVAVAVAAGPSLVGSLGPARARRRLAARSRALSVPGGPGVHAVSGAARARSLPAPRSVAKAVVGRLAGSERAARRADRDLPVLVDQVVRHLRTGASLPGAVAVAAVARPDPSTARLASELAHGTPLVVALDAWQEAVPTSARRLAAAALGLAAESGGAVAMVLDGVGDTLRDRVALEREVAALSSQARASAAVLVVAPVSFAVLAAVADRRVARVLLGSPAGWACLLAGAVLDVLGALWMARLVGRAR